MNPTLQEKEEALSVFGEWWGEQQVLMRNPHASVFMESCTAQLVSKVASMYDEVLGISASEW